VQSAAQGLVAEGFLLNSDVAGYAAQAQAVTVFP